jgi:hypothetical protein
MTLEIRKEAIILFFYTIICHFTIKYPEMVASIAPYFSNGNIPIGIGKDNFWFI